MFIASYIAAESKKYLTERLMATSDPGGEVKKRVWISSMNVEEDVCFVAY
jgi:hypothetical protein